MRGLVGRSLLGQYLLAVGVLLPAVVAFAVVVDFAGSAHFFKAEDFAVLVPTLFANKSLLAMQQLAPAAVLLAGGVVVSALRQRGELTGLRALGFAPGALLGPLALGALAVAATFIAVDDRLVGDASRRVDAIMTGPLKRWASARAYAAEQQWFRAGPHFLHLRHGQTRGAFQGVAIFTVSPDFTLARRIDAAAMEPLGGTRWRMRDGSVWHFDEASGAREERFAAIDLELGVEPSRLRVRPGRPEQLPAAELAEQVAIRREVGLPVRAFELALHNRFSYALAAVPGALLAALLAMRRGRRGHLTTTLVEGTALTLGMWGLTVICRSFVLSERMSPATAAWTPFALLSVAAGAGWLLQEGAWPRLREVLARGSPRP